MIYRLLLTATLILYSTPYAAAQGYVDQDTVRDLLNSQQTSVDSTTPVSWHKYIYDDRIKDNGLGNWSEFLAHIDSLPGHHTTIRRYIVELANRITGDNFKKGMTLLIPDSFPQDYKAYSPYPFYYTAADTLPKLLIIDKHTQTFGAYEYGKLVRWGILSSGKTNDKTPAGRYNFNWKDDYRLSNAAPPGEKWELYYMFNFQAKWGIHVHQYSLPIGKPVSHGCVRVTMADALWNYSWANGWIYESNTLVRNGTPVMVINENAKGKIAHWQTDSTAVTSLVSLPENLLAIPPGLHSSISVISWFSGW